MAVSRDVPEVPGLCAFPSLLSDDFANKMVNAIGEADLFHGGHRDQVMLFSRSQLSKSADAHGESAGEEPVTSDSALPYIPAYLQDLLSHLSDLLLPLIPAETHELLFAQSLARQIILNLYPPGAGITPHVDLPNRYADGILGVSLLGSCVMDLESDVGEVANVYMPRGTVYALTGEARWDWSHGIEGRMEDVVLDEDEGGSVATNGQTEEPDERMRGKTKARTIIRGTRLSVTFRWMSEGADVLS